MYRLAISLALLARFFRLLPVPDRLDEIRAKQVSGSVADTRYDRSS
jgi:hypothetical protein